MTLRTPRHLMWDDRLAEADKQTIDELNQNLDQLNELRALEINVSGYFARSMIAWKLAIWQHALLHRILADRLVPPPLHTKTGEKHEVPLTKLMHAVIAAQPHEARSTAHLRLGEDRRCDQRVWTKLVAGLQHDAGVAFTPHDLRRTCRTLMSRLGVVTEIAALAIGHQAARPSANVFLVIVRITYH